MKKYMKKYMNEDMNEDMKKTYNQRPKSGFSSGFSLLEMSIVLVILGFIAAAVVVGQSVLENSSLQSAIADYDRYRQAALDYKTRYKELPGDHSNATSITSDAVGCQTPADSTASFTATCNGNGDGIVGVSTGDPLADISVAGTVDYEPLFFWQHLMNAGFLPGPFNGRAATSGTIGIGINVPKSSISGASFLLRYFPTNTVTNTSFRANYGNVFFLGAPGGTATLPLNGAALTPEQAKYIDQKIDDGKPGLGKVLTSPQSVLTNCATTSVETTAVYNSAVTTAACAMIFITGF